MHLNLVLIAFLAAVCFPIAAAQRIELIVHIPANTPAGESVYLAGSLPGVGSWKADGVKLIRGEDHVCRGFLDLEIGQTLEYKITRGNWQSVEKNVDGTERANRTLVVDAATHQVEITVDRWASADAPKPARTVVGDLKIHRIASRILGGPRNLRIWLPPGYDDDPAARYPVLYMHDGQNCFDRAISAFGEEWEIDETLTRLIGENAIAPLIVVGIDNAGENRIKEYTYVADSEHGGGDGAKYAEFLLKEVRPLVEEKFRVRTGPVDTYIGGSSLGGLVSLEIARRNPGIFGGVIAMSPSLWWANGQVLAEIEHDAGGLQDARIWIDMGAAESIARQPDSAKRFVEQARQLDRLFSAQQINHQLMVDEVHTQHNERAWAHRFPQAIAWLLEERKQ